MYIGRLHKNQHQSRPKKDVFSTIFTIFNSYLQLAPQGKQKNTKQLLKDPTNKKDENSTTSVNPVTPANSTTPGFSCIKLLANVNFEKTPMKIKKK